MTSNLRSRFDRELVHRFGIVAVLLLISVALAATTDNDVKAGTCVGVNSATEVLVDINV